ncbi:hypothetical protein HN903_01800 [archaeon]|jgi:hypothetical protein|nr:hypothetical protein [archaeon]MBT6956474.1 hypothetical protein [archaeon]MBT7128467.1 hypothetical protein [archaeon]
MNFIIEFFISIGFIARTKPIMIDSKLAGLAKLQRELSEANRINARLAADKMREEERAEKAAKKAAEKEAAELKAKIEALEKESKAKQDSLEAGRNTERRNAAKFITTAKEEAEKASIISGNLVAITTKRIATK